MQYAQEHYQAFRVPIMKRFTGIFTALAFFTVTPAFADSTYSEMYVFGDSLSDPGNAFVVTGEISTRPYNASGIPDAPYPIGKGKTFSNGATWAQVFGKAYHFQGATGPALRVTRFTNYAFGGASAADSLDNPFDMGEQVSQFLIDRGGMAEPDALHTVWFGGNDVRDALVAYLVAYETTLYYGGSEEAAHEAGEAAAGTVILNSITAYMENMTALVLSGAVNFLILNAPNVGVAPAVTMLGSDATNLAWFLSAAFNSALDGALDGLESAFPLIQVDRVDAFDIITKIVFTPAPYGLSNTTESCITPEVKKGAICDDPDEYLFWDGLHPTRAGHEVVAEEVMKAME